MSSPYHAAYFAQQLTKHGSSHQLEKLSKSIFNATVDLNPHQIEAALFAFRSPLSRGALLADEVGVGKTIEAGLNCEWGRDDYSLEVSALPAAPTPEEEAAKRIEELPLFAKEDRE